MSADGAVPMEYRLADGNTSDDPTHVPTWDGLVKVLGRRDFLYVADSKLCSRDAMRRIHGEGGRFVTVLPRTRGEDKWFRDWIQTNQPQWAEALRLPGERIGDLVHVLRTAALRRGLPHHLGPQQRQGRPRRAHPRSRIEVRLAAIDALNTRLAGPKTRLKTRPAVEAAAAAALAEAGAARLADRDGRRDAQRPLGG